ncbi:MAG: DUF5049 domain-containing protein [Chloroflexota bacterium]|nr:DUF5049 domain-containing protein [Chloroflexota bacterium]
MERARLEGGPVAVPPSVLAGLEAVRRSGLTNMLDKPAVARVAAGLGHPEAADWMKSHPCEYAKGVFRGFKLEVGEL